VVGGKIMTRLLETPIYAIADNGDMLYYRHAGFADG
jgi:hypothetical protein